MMKSEIIREWLSDINTNIESYKRAIKGKENDIAFCKSRIKDLKLGRQVEENLKMIQYYNRQIETHKSSIEFLTKMQRRDEYRVEFINAGLKNG